MKLENTADGVPLQIPTLFLSSQHPKSHALGMTQATK